MGRGHVGGLGKSQGGTYKENAGRKDKSVDCHVQPKLQKDAVESREMECSVRHPVGHIACIVRSMIGLCTSTATAGVPIFF